MEMTKTAAIDKIKCFPNWNLDDQWLDEDEIQELTDIAVSAIEKQIPKKPITYNGTNRADCPMCGAAVKGINKPFGDWCVNCGQAIDWN